MIPVERVAGLLEEHEFYPISRLWDCKCTWKFGDDGHHTHAAHVAQVLAEADLRPDSPRCADDLVPSGSMVVARVEILELMRTDGSMGYTWHAGTSDGDMLDLAKLLGILEYAKFDIVYNSID